MSDILPKLLAAVMLFVGLSAGGVEAQAPAAETEEIVRKGLELNAPLHLTWSCYQREDVACGVCDSCALRLRGFQRAGGPDPIPYNIRPDYA